MKNIYKAVKITDKVYWVGAIDWSVRDFHGYLTSRGTTYNAYLILADKITLIDTVKAPFREEMMSRIASVVNPEDIIYIVSNHSEMDHSGCLPETIKALQPEKVFASAMGVKALGEHFRGDSDIEAINAVKTGDTIDLGNMSLQIMETKLLHWPDSMFSYLPEQKLLFSQDGFGMHLASSSRFADEIAENLLYYEGAKYFANILLLYSDRVLAALEQVQKAGMVIDVIAPDHGPVWRKDIDKILNWYTKWAEQVPEKKVVIPFATMWKSTEFMAQAIAEGVSSQGITVKQLPLSGNHRSDVATEILNAGALIVGSPTINNNLFPTVADMLCYLKGLKPRNLIGFSFGSYGWSGESINHLDKELTDMGVKITGPGIKSKYVPDNNILEVCYNRGAEVGARLKKGME